MEYILSDLTQPEMQLIVDGLADRPHRQVAALLTKLLTQTQAQELAARTAAPAPVATARLDAA